MNHTIESKPTTTKPYPYGRTMGLPPLEEKVTNGLVKGYNTQLSNSVALAERRKSDERGAVSKPLWKKMAVVALSAASLFGVYEFVKPHHSTPKLDSTYIATGNETPSGIAKEVMGNDNPLNLQDKLAKDSMANGEPGYQPNEQVHVPHQYVEHVQEELQKKP